jgi:endonuclease/exonuclease/phosphatase family metal-dependent hydrolase
MPHALRFRVVTYNIHKCVGMDRRLSAERIAAVLAATDSDVVALQEVVRTNSERRGGDQIREIATKAGFEHCCFGENRPHWGGSYGNAILSRWPITAWENHDLTVRGREPRGMLQADIRIHGSAPIHILNVHLGTGYLERRRQADNLLGERLLSSGKFKGPRILLGDFNEWTRGKSTQVLSRHMKSAEPPVVQRRRFRSYPGILPILHLDHIYYDDPLDLLDFRLLRTKVAMIASDHLPLIADFEISG